MEAAPTRNLWTLARLRDLDGLRAMGLRPAWFGLGFIQLKLDETYRLHVWHPDLQGHIPAEELHDHRYSFHSTILAGRLEHRVFAVEMDPDGDHEMSEASCAPRKTSAAPVSLGRCRIRETESYRLAAGSSYYLDMDRFHIGAASAAATLLRRGQKLKETARVVRPLETTPACPFAETRSEATLWTAIAEILEVPARF